MRNARKEGSGLVTSVLLPIGLICVFAFCSLLLVVVGIDVYRQVQDSGDESFENAVVASYIRTKISENNKEGKVYLRSEADADALVIEMMVSGGSVYETVIYFKDGNLYESFQPAGQALNDSLSTLITPLESCSFNIDENGLFTAELETNRGVYSRAVITLAGGSAL